MNALNPLEVMIHKNERVYIDDWFDSDQEFGEGDKIVFEMPSFCSGDYIAEIFVDNDGDHFIKKEDDFSGVCRTYWIERGDITNFSVDVLADFCKKISKQKDCPKEFIEIVNKEFWNLI